MDNLTPNNKARLQNILQFYTEYRKTNYDDIHGIEIENKKRQAKQEEINKQLQKIENIKKTEKYVLLHNEKYNIIKQIGFYQDNINEFRNTYAYDEHITYKYTKIEEEVIIICHKLYHMIKMIEDKQLDIIKGNGIDTELLEISKIEKLL